LRWARLVSGFVQRENRVRAVWLLLCWWRYLKQWRNHMLLSNAAYAACCRQHCDDAACFSDCSTGNVVLSWNKVLLLNFDLLIVCHTAVLEYTKALFCNRLFYAIALRPLANIQHFLFYVLYFSVWRALVHLCPYFDLRPLFQEEM